MATQSLVTKRQFLRGLALGALAVAGNSSVYANQNAAENNEIIVYKSASCSCCHLWVAYLKEEGFKVKAVDVEDASPYKTKAGVSAEESSCHTAFVQGYALEGHVPAAAIHKLLRERPAIKGLTVPGMPANSPGMGKLNGKLKTLEISTGRVYSTD